jgi:hypothetical protein
MDFSGTLLGLSLTALSPASAWYFIVCLFSPKGRKKTHKELNMIGKRKMTYKGKRSAMI